MAKLPFHSMLNITAYFLSFTIIINLSSSARTFETPARNRHHSHPKLSFLIRDVLNTTPHPSTSHPPNTKAATQLPFSKPLGFFPPNRGIPIPETYTTTTTSAITDSSAQTLDLSTIGVSFPTRAALQELEYGVAREIDEELFEILGHKPQVVGRIEGLYVENGGDSGGHMMAMTVYFGNKGEAKDGMRVFGVYRNDVKESHVAVIGGIGKYLGANGYVTLKRSVRAKFNGGNDNFLEFNVYFSK